MQRSFCVSELLLVPVAFALEFQCILQDGFVLHSRVWQLGHWICVLSFTNAGQFHNGNVSGMAWRSVRILEGLHRWESLRA